MYCLPFFPNEPCHYKKGLNETLRCITYSKTSPNYGDIKLILLNNLLNYDVEWSFYIWRVLIYRTISVRVSMCKLRRLTGLDTSLKCIKHPFHRAQLK